MGRNFERELKELINRYGVDNDTNTPDFLLTEYLLKCLQAYKETVRNNDIWHGRMPEKETTL